MDSVININDLFFLARSEAHQSNRKSAENGINMGEEWEAESPQNIVKSALQSENSFQKTLKVPDSINIMQ